MFSIILRTAAAAALLLLAAPPPAAGADDAQQCLALSMYFEAREEGREAMEAVGWVVLNRVADPEFPDAVCEVIKEGGETPPCQFSWWCDGRSDRPQDEDEWALARDVADDLLADPPADPTGGALFFHSGGHPTGWHAERERTVRLNNHIFYR